MIVSAAVLFKSEANAVHQMFGAYSRLSMCGYDLNWQSSKEEKLQLLIDSVGSDA